MNYTLDNLIGILRSRLQDEEFDSTILTTFLNDSMNEILGEDKYPFMQRIDKYTAESHGEINLPPQYAGTFYIYAKQGKEPRQELQYIEPELFFENTKKRTFVYTTFANTLFYRIRPDENDEGFDITHLYLENPRPLVNLTDRPPIPPQFMEALILGALARAEQLRDNFDFAQIYENKQDQLLTNMKVRLSGGNLTAENRARLPLDGGLYNAHI